MNTMRCWSYLSSPGSRWCGANPRSINRDYHIEIATLKYSVPYTYAGQSVDVRIVGAYLAVMCAGEIIAEHTVPDAKYVFITDADHAPAAHRAVSGSWTRAYFLRQAQKVGLATVEAITQVLNRQRIEAQGYRGCQNILNLVKGSTENKLLLERACHELLVRETDFRWLDGQFKRRESKKNSERLWDH